MIIQRLIFVFTLAASIIFYILYPPWISWYLLVLMLLLIPFDLLISLPGMLSVGMTMFAPRALVMGEDGVLAITLTRERSFPVRCIIVKLNVTGDDFVTTCRIKCGGERDSRSEVIIDTSRTGVTSFEVKRIWTVSLIGIFSLPLTGKGREAVLVLPPPVKPVNTVSLQQGTLLRPKPGGGPSDEHDMRDYRQGDPVRSIHWKVSAKFDSLIIREPLEPPPHSRLVHIMKWDETSERDLILGRLMWVSDYLLKWQMPFYVKFGDGVMIAEIKQEPDLIDYLLAVLDHAAHREKTSVSLPTRFTWVFQVDAGIGAGAAAGDDAEVLAGVSALE